MATDERFADLKRLLERNGWTHVRARGSHHVFKGEGRALIVLPVHGGRVKAVYAREVRKAIDALGKAEEEGRE
jgi:hypothetical protein